jgi:hypothetical protein
MTISRDEVVQDVVHVIIGEGERGGNLGHCKYTRDGVHPWCIVGCVVHTRFGSLGVLANEDNESKSVADLRSFFERAGYAPAAIDFLDTLQGHADALTPLTNTELRECTWQEALDKTLKQGV